MSEPNVPDRKSKLKPRDPAKLCIRLNANGEPCQAYRLKGTTLCWRHSTKKIRERAKQRLWELVPKAQDELERVLVQTDPSDSNKMRAIDHIIDRTLGTVTQQVQIDMQSEQILWNGEAFVQGVTWVGGEEDIDDEAERDLHAVTQNQLESATDDEVVEAELVDDPDDPWATAGPPTAEQQRARVKRAQRAQSRRR